MKKIRKAVSRAAKKFFSINKLFSRFVIVVCLSYMVHVTERVLDIAEYNGMDCYSILAAAGVVFGGELLLLAFKDVIAEKANAVIEKIKSKTQNID